MNLRENIKKELRNLNEQANPNNCHYQQYICQNAVSSPGFPNVDACHMFKSNGLYNINDSCNIYGGGHTIFSHNKTNSQWFSYLGNPSPGDKFKYVRQTPSGSGAVQAWNMEYLGIDPMGCVGSIPDPSGPPVPCSSPPPTTGCNPNGPFPGNFNLQNWTNNWTSLPNFSSSNPNQPCNFVCQRRNQWTSQLAAGGMGPAQTNMIECKLAEAENQYQIHGCAQMNTNNCP